MALNGADLRPSPGVLTYTPNGGSAQAIGGSIDGVHLFTKFRWEPILVEELADTPLDYIALGGPVIAVVTGVQWDTATRNALAAYAISGSTLVFTTNDWGKKATDLSYGALAFDPDLTASGSVSWTAAIAVPLINHDRPYAPEFRKRKLVEHAITFGILPPAGGGNLITISEDS